MKQNYLIWMLAALLLPGTLLFAKEAKNASPAKITRPEILCPLKPDPPPIIDGDRREWERVPSSIPVTERNVTWGKAKWKDEEDLSGTVSLSYDQNYLYLLVEVVDEKIIVDDSKFFNTDHVELSFVPFLDEKATGALPKDSLFVFGFTPGTPEKTGDALLDVEACASMVFPPNQPWKGVDVESSFTEEGYILEARIPWSVLRVKPNMVKVGQVFGIDVHISDSDSGKTQETMTSLNHLTPWKGRRWENMPRMVLTGTDGKKPTK